VGDYVRVAEETPRRCQSAVNALLLNGKTTQTVSSRAHSQSGVSKAWRITERALDLIFWFDKDHCATSFLKESE
jgi:hypothetical protein